MGLVQVCERIHLNENVSKVDNVMDLFSMTATMLLLLHVILVVQVYENNLRFKFYYCTNIVRWSLREGNGCQNDLIKKTLISIVC